MNSIECQLIEGGTGDLLVVSDDTDKLAITCPVRTEVDDEGSKAQYYDPDGELVTVNGGRIKKQGWSRKSRMNHQVWRWHTGKRSRAEAVGRSREHSGNKHGLTKKLNTP